jgi:ATP-dependent Clp protease ATP-binding subunit ClpC
MATEIVFPVGVLHRKLGPGAVLAEPLFTPEVARLAGSRERAAAATARSLRQFLGESKPESLIRRRRATAARELVFSLTLDPPRANASWREPVELTFHAAVWDEAGRVLARVPALGIEVVAGPKDDLTDRLRREALAALRRQDASANLRNLAATQTTTAFRIEWMDVPVRLYSLKERAERAERNEEEDDKRTALQQVGTLMAPGEQSPVHEVEEWLRPIVDALTAKPPQGVLLVGPSGVGKTAIVRELVRRKAELGFAETPFFRTSGSRIVAGQCGFGMWEKRCQDLVKDATRRKAVVHLGSLVELMDVGKSEFNATGIATFLRPAIARGELLAIAECTPEQLPLIEKENPQLPDAFRTVTVEEPDRARGRRILAAVAADHPRRAAEPGTLDTVDRLHRRFATYSAYPGRPLRFLQDLIRDGARGEPVRAVEVYDAFARETGLPRAIVDPDEALDLAATRDWFGRRVVGQTEAVDLVVDLLATVKAGLTRVDRPIASLLFIGPTGVGKTELAKALAEFLFGSRDRLTRFDMSEYADPVSVRRLVGTGFGAEGLLTAKVREQPFGVLLLDEIEKAHPAAFDLLLQALGEARLTDAGGRLADFRNTVVILTSNLGAESFRSGSPGFGGGGASDAKEHFAKSVEKFLRPELFNRLDRIVPFGSLPPEIIRAIADREWRKVLARDGIRFRDLTVTAGDGLLDHLAAVGFDPRYGARPLKRAMERELLAPLARQVNRHSGGVPLVAEVGVRDGAPLATARPVQGATARPESAYESSLGAAALAAQSQRRWHQLLAQSSTVRELENDVTRLLLRERRLLGRRKQGRKLGRELEQVLAELGRLRDVHAEVARARAAAERTEDDALAAYYADGDAGALPDRVKAAEAEWDRLLLRLYALDAPRASRVALHIFAESPTTRADLASGYRAIARDHGLRVEAVRYRLPGAQPPLREPDKPPPQAHKKHPATAYWHEDQLFSKAENPHRLVLWRERVPSPFDPLEKDDAIGYGLEFQGDQAHLRFSAEAGWHQFDKPAQPDADTPDAMVFASSDALEAYLPDVKFARKGAIGAERYRRTWNRAKGTVCDIEWMKVQPGPFLFRANDPFPKLLAAAVDLTVRVRLMQMIVE